MEGARNPVCETIRSFVVLHGRTLRTCPTLACRCNRRPHYVGERYEKILQAHVDSLLVSKGELLAHNKDWSCCEQVQDSEALRVSKGSPKSHNELSYGDVEEKSKSGSFAQMGDIECTLK